MNTWLRLITNMFVVSFWASPRHAMDHSLPAHDFRGERMLQHLKVYDPGFPRDDPPPDPSPNPTRFPTDVPAPEPHDVPAPEPIDDPPPEPGKDPSPAKPPMRPQQDPKPRPIP